MVRRPGAWFAALVVSAVSAACGASTTSTDDDGAGTPTGGTAGVAQGGSASAGMGGTSGSATGGAALTGGQPTLGGSGGTSGAASDPLSDRDDDGITDEQEGTKGTNPDAKDTDGDGCDDLLETSFGECDLETMASVYSCAIDAEAHVVLTIADGTGSRMDDLTTAFVPIAGVEEDMWSQVTAVVPESAGDSNAQLQLVSVEPGARVEFRVIPNVVFTWSGVRKYALQVSSASGGLLGEAMILWRRKNCPAMPE